MIKYNFLNLRFSISYFKPYNCVQPNGFCKKEIVIHNQVSSSSYRAGSTDIPDPLSPLPPIVHRPR